MAFGPPPATIVEVRDPDRIKRYTLVPRSPAGAKPDGVKRFTLARVGATPRSALGADRLERMEQIADAEREQQSRNGGDPMQKRLDDQAAE
jgi:hypothetical protein